MNKLKSKTLITFVLSTILLFQVISGTTLFNITNTNHTTQNLSIQRTNYLFENKSFLIITSQPFLADFTQNIVGKLFKVQSTVKGTEDPHSYTPTISDSLVISSANIFIYYGVADIDGWVTGIIPTLPSTVHTVKLINLSKDGLYDPYIGSGEQNPHLWMWPFFVNNTLVERIYSALVRFDPVHINIYQQNLYNYRKQLGELIQRVNGTAALLKGVETVEYHAAYFYLLHEMNVTRIGAIEQIENQLPSAVHFSNITTLMKNEIDKGKTVIIVQSMNIPPDTTWQVSRDTGAKISYVAALIGNYQTVNFTSYIEMIDYDLYALTHPTSAPNAATPGFELPTVLLTSIFILMFIIYKKK